MSSYADTLENKLNDFLLRAQSLAFGGATATWSAAPVLYVGLLGVVGNDAGGETELVGANYARVPLTASLTSWNNTQGNTTGASTGSDGTGENAAALNFNTPGAGGWGTANGFGFYEAATGGSPVIKSTLAIAKTINQGDAVSFAAGALSVQQDN